MRIEIADIKIGRNRREAKTESVAKLAASISEVGLLNPITVDEEHRLIAGLHRLRACKSLGWEKIEAHVLKLDADHAKLAQIDENLIRNEGTQLARAEWTAERKVLYLKLHPETKQGGGGQGGRARVKTDTVSFSIDTAAKTGATERTVRRDVQVGSLPEPVRDLLRDTSAADDKRGLLALVKIKDPEKQATIARAVSDGSSATIKAAIQNDRRKDVRETPLPLTKFRVIYADPPWQYNNSGLDSSAASHYETMPIDAICALPISGLCTNETVLFMWATNPLLPEALRAIAAWGFEYKTNLCWVKTRASGIGWWAKSKHELLLVATRKGSMKPEPSARPESCFEAPVGQHSRKPDLVYALIEKACLGPYVELFCRRPREGWEVWGNEV